MPNSVSTATKTEWAELRATPNGVPMMPAPGAALNLSSMEYHGKTRPDPTPRNRHVQEPETAFHPTEAA